MKFAYSLDSEAKKSHSIEDDEINEEDPQTKRIRDI